jgi:lipopolysaccharide/colanic/teichoic acid biosynthesis glycosyltransferase
VGLPDLPRNAYQALFSALGATAAAAIAISVAQLLVGSAVLPRFVVFWAALFLIPGYALTAFVAHRGRKRGEDRDRVVAIAEPDEVAAFVAELARRPERPAALVWAMAPADSELDLLEAVDEMRATVVVLARAAQADDRVVAQAAALHERGVRIRTLSLFYDEWLGKMPISELERMSLMFDIGEIHRVRYGRLKRLGDVIAGLVSFPFFLLAVPFVALGNLVANRGPLLYSQDRVGKGGTPFRIVKFRTMEPGGATSEWTREDDPRITPFGRFLRVTHLDELPQAWNMLRGDLSIVGPRPEQPRYVEELTEKIPFYGLRHLVRPGLTGWAQVKYPYGADEIDALEKLQYEFYYLRHQSLTLDLRIVGRTIRHVIGGGGR